MLGILQAPIISSISELYKNSVVYFLEALWVRSQSKLTKKCLNFPIAINKRCIIRNRWQTIVNLSCST